MSKCMLMILTMLAMTAFDSTLNAKEQQSAALMQRTAPPRAAANVRLEAKTADAATVSGPASGAQKAYSKREYMLLRRRYKANQPQAYEPLSGSRLTMEAKVIRENMVVGRRLWPVAKDAIYGKVAAVEKKLDAGLNPDSTVFLAYPYNANLSLLDLAIRAGQRGIIRVLLEHGASVNSNAGSPDEFALKGRRPIFEAPLPLAASYGEDDVIRVLLKHGADIDQRFGLPRNNGTALAEAVYAEGLSTVYLLLTHGASIKAAFGPGGTIPPVLLQGALVSPRMVALRNLLIRNGARMPPGR